VIQGSARGPRSGEAARVEIRGSAQAMEYRVELFGTPLPAAATLEALLASEDAAAVSDLDRSQHVWRVSTSLASGELLALLERLGCRVAPARVKVLPSICCGGCSG
jgi:hypothetical protein